MRRYSKHDRNPPFIRSLLILSALAFTLWLLCLGGCSDDDDNPTSPNAVKPGNLFVRVQRPGGQIVPDALVLTRPETERVQTDELGTVMLNDLSPGIYTLWANHGTYGTGNTPVNIEEGKLTEALVVLQPGVFLQPSVNITTPGWGWEMSYVDTLVLRGIVSDLNDPAEELQLTWSSNVTGLISDDPADPDGITELVLEGMETGYQVFKLQAENSEGFVGADSVLVGIMAWNPTAEILEPYDGQGYTPGETITFRAEVFDYETPADQLVYEWSSDLSGVIGTGNPDAGGGILLEKADLPAGEHLITLKVTDTDTMSVEKSIQVVNLVPESIDPLLVDVSGGVVTLTWTASTDPDFDRYEIFRSLEPGLTGTVIGQIGDAATNNYRDEAAPLAAEVFYHVRVFNTHGYYRPSEVVRVESPGGLILATEPAGMLIHPMEPWVYLDYGGTLYRVDFTAMEILNTGTVTAGTGWKSLGDAGQGLEIYCPGTDGWIRILDPVDFTEITTINTGLRSTSAIAGPNGVVYASVMPSPWWEQPLRTYDRSTGFQIDGGGDFDGCRLRMLPSEREIIEITTGVSPVDMDYYRFDDAGMILEHFNDSQHGGTPLSPYVFDVSPNGQFLVTSSSAALYSATSSMDYLGQLPRGSRYFTDFAFSQDGNTIYAAVSQEKLIQTYTYPSLQQSSQMTTRTEPLFIERQGDVLVVVGSIDGGFGEPEAALEIIQLGP